MLAESRRGVICTPHHDASAAGMRMLDAGGSAIDAMLAASAALAAVYPHMTGLGGDALPDFHIPDRALLAFGTERQGLSKELLGVADHRVSIPMENGVSSLNLATSVAVILYHWKLRQ